MRISIISDLHIEHRPDDGQKVLSTLETEGVDVLIVAGDLCGLKNGSFHTLEKSLEFLCQIFPHVIFVPGNHEYYKSSFEEFDSFLSGVVYPNLTVLDCRGTSINGQKFVGGTMWFADDPMNVSYSGLLNDFRMIDGFLDNVYSKHAACVNVIEELVDESTVVVTHHLPSEKSVHSRFKGNPINRFFVHNMERVIYEFSPRVWVHGHTHFSCDYDVAGTRVVCNPYGYFHDENCEFSSVIIEV